jgi:deoxyribonuclease V
MKVRELHRWDVSPAEARRIQHDVRGLVRLDDGISVEQVRVVAGADNGYARRGARTTAIATVVVLSFPDLEVIETRTAAREVEFPYVPGLLSFREAPALIAAFEEVRHEPDVVLFDAQGIAHPRRLGAASHMGVLLDRPAIGCAKTRLTGHYEEPGDAFGDRSALVDRGDVLGAAVRTRLGRPPLFVSPGHRISVDTAVAIVLACCRNNRFMPEPTRLADRMVREAKVRGQGTGARE